MSDNSELEKEFAILVKTIGEEILEKANAASLLLEEACSLSEKHGIPFYSPVSHLGQSYVPASFANKFSALDYEKIADLTDVYSGDLKYGYGWKQSAIC